MKPSMARTLLFGFAVLTLVWGNQTWAAARAMQEGSAPAGLLTTSLFADEYWSYHGLGGVELGYAVHTAGDINADGYADVIIGAPKYTLNIDREGGAFVFYGGPSGLSSTPDTILGGGQQGALFGQAVSTAGDVNGDGFDDIIIGANEYKVAFDLSITTNGGAVFVYHGSEGGLSPTHNWSVLAEARDISLGRAVSAAGDVNKDGYDDVIVSAPHYGSSSEQDSEGKIYLYLGGASGLNQTPAWSYECDQANALCGNSLDAAGDLNQDGYDDIIIGAPSWNGSFSNEGLALVFFGCPDGLSPDPGWSMAGGQEGAQFGWSVAGAGDVNGDGHDDLLVGAKDFTLDTEILQAGAAFSYYGTSTVPSLSPDWAAYGEEAYARYGHSLHQAGDVNSDGYGDIIIGSHLLGDSINSDYPPNVGGVYLYKGGPGGLETSTSWTHYGDKAEAKYGYSVGTAGDVDGDLADDILVSTPYYRIDEKNNSGKAYAYYGQGDGNPFSVYLPVIIIR